MPTYVYETIPENDGDPVEQFEVTQRITDAALTAHPDSGKPVRRIISAGGGFISGGSNGSSEVSVAKAPAAHCCGGGCKH